MSEKEIRKDERLKTIEEVREWMLNNQEMVDGHGTMVYSLLLNHFLKGLEVEVENETSN